MTLFFRKEHMYKRFIRLILLCLIYSHALVAGDIKELINWKPHAKHPGMVLPVLNNETPLQAINRYRAGLYKTADLSQAMARHKVTKAMLSGNTFEPISLKAIKESPRPSFLLIANKFQDYTPAYYRIWDFINPIVKNGGVAHLLPISVDVSLNKRQASEFRALVAESFDALFGMGGEDVDPALYNEKITHSIHVTPTRDASEVKMIKAYIQKKKGVYFGICRGSQICFVAKGGSLHQDLIADGITDDHADLWHQVKIVKKDDNLMRAFLGKNKKEVSVYSYHHQAVKEGTSEVLVNSFEGDGVNRVVEGYQFKNGLGLTFQFHPEMMHNKDGDTIMKGLVSYSSFVKEQKALGPNCQNLVLKFLDSSF